MRCLANPLYLKIFTQDENGLLIAFKQKIQLFILRFHKRKRQRKRLFGTVPSRKPASGKSALSTDAFLSNQNWTVGSADQCP
jgi:hypothetical protein